MTTNTYQLTLDGTPLTVTEQGEGQPVLLLHGGGGPQTVGGFAGLLATSGARVITPVHPGFGGTPRPGSLATMGGLAQLYARLLEELGLESVTVIGNSMGGWVAAELALLAGDRVARIVLVDAVGIEVDGHPVADIFPLSPAELSRLSFFDPAKFMIDPATLPEEQRRIAVANREALAVYGGRPSMTDPGLRARLHEISVPALVVWGEADRVCDPEYGRAFAAAIPGAQFVLLARTGHLPQIEAPAELLRAVLQFAGARSAN
jgi:pimeloyl-ACP methyl ester carboxylesterase